jgi:hypothetical protein
VAGSEGRNTAADQGKPPDLDRWINYVQIAAVAATLVSGWFTGLPWVPCIVLALVVATCLYAFFVLRKANQASKRSRDKAFQNKLAWAAFLVIIGLVFLIAYMANRKDGALQASTSEFAARSRLHSRPIATIDDLKQDRIVGKTVYICDVLRSIPESERLDRPPTIRFRKFEDCEIVGPAVVMLTKRTDLLYCIFPAPEGQRRHTEEALFLELAPGRHLAGMLEIEECKFDECVFSGVTIAGNGESIRQIKKGFINSP